MKNLRAYLLGCVAALLAVQVCLAGDPALFQTFNLNASSLAGTTTNSTAGTSLKLDDGQKIARIFVTATGASSTNGTFVVKLSTASGAGTTTNEYDNAQDSLIKVTMSRMTGSATTVSDWFVIDGSKYIRVGQMENTFAGTVSNINVRIGYSK